MTAASRILPRWRTDAFLACAIALNYAARGVLPVVLPAIKAEFYVTDASLGLLGSLFFWTYALSAPFTGIFSDLYPRRAMVLLSVICWSATTLLNGVAPSWVMLVVLRVGFGFSESFYLPAATALQADHHGPETRTVAFGLNSLAQNAGPVVGAACAGWIAERWGWRYAFGVIGLFGIALALSARRFLGEAPVAPGKPAPRAKVAEAMAYLFRDVTYWLLVANEFLCGAAVWIFFYWLPTFLGETYGIKLAAAGFAGMAMLQFSGMGGTAIGTWISHRAPGLSPRGRQLIFGATSTAAAPCLLCFLFRPSYLVVGVALVAFNLLRGVGGVYELPVLCDVVPTSYRATAVGILISLANLAGGVGVLAAGVLKVSLGLPTVFALMSGICGLAGLALLVGWWKFVRPDTARASAWAAAR